MSRHFVRSLVLVCAALVAFCSRSEDAHAETSAWISVNGGTNVVTLAESEVTVRGTMTFDLGVGSTPTEPFIFGSLFRVAPIFEEGTDLQFLLRGASRGFQTGDFGLAVDLGGYLRTFGDPISGGFVGAVVLGGPLGTQLSIGGNAGTNQGFGASATLGIDLLRLTLYRESLTEWWPNPLSPSAPEAGPTVARF